MSLLAGLLSGGPAGSHILLGREGLGRPTAGHALEQGTVSISPFPVRALDQRRSLAKVRAGPPVITDVRHNMLSPSPHSWGGRKGASLHCPNIWTSQREPRCVVQMFSNLNAGCRQRADIWVEINAYVRGERVYFVQRFREVLAQSWGWGCPPP